MESRESRNAVQPLYLSLPTPSFSRRGQGKSPPRLHKALVEVNRTNAAVILRPTLPFQLMEPKSEAVGPMKPLQGPTPVAAQMDPPLCVDNDPIHRKKLVGKFYLSN